MLTLATDEGRRQALARASSTIARGYSWTRAAETTARIYAEAYRRDPKFYRLVETLKTYESSMGANGVLLLSTDSELYRELKSLR